MNSPVLRWLLLLLLVFDLASSPFHAHLHAFAGQEVVAATAAADHHVDEAASTDAEADEHAAYAGHLLAALFPAGDHGAGPAPALAPWPVSLQVPGVTVPPSWLAATSDRRRPPARSYARPAGRAPPLFLA